MGHVLRSPVKRHDRISNNPFKNALEMIRRYRVKAMKGERVLLSRGQLYKECITDSKGYFEFEIKDIQEGNYQVSLQENEGVQSLKIQFPEEVNRVVVTDIDDTVLISHSTNLIKKLYLLLTKNHESRKGFEGVSEFYKELLGANGVLFYVSSSEWNLYDFLNDFMKFHQLPKGVFLLQDLKSGIFDLFRSGGGSHDHKKQKIQRLLDAFPDCKFVLVGDSGQKDPEIYRSIVEQFPNRIEHVFIRDVKKSHRSKLKQLSRQLRAYEVPLEVLSK